ncbi:MAG: molybdopterin-dependent oxidoreductase, partial [Proteobacteria bacterium]|nr:molybdopterin-dependent oxidoreductase [Pseudomonadota bacterium]
MDTSLVALTQKCPAFSRLLPASLATPVPRYSRRTRRRSPIRLRDKAHRIPAPISVRHRPGTDAALALAACRVTIDEGLYAADYLREQTDLPFLVRADTQRFLRESDVAENGSDECFAVWDEASEALLWAPGTAGSSHKTLALPQAARPALEVRREIRLASGDSVAVDTVFSTLRRKLAHFDPEQAARITGVPATVIRRFARDFARAPSALIISQYGMCKNYHSDLIQRCQILLASLTGKLGRPGSGWRAGSFVALDGLGLVAMQDKLGIPHLLWTAARSYFNPEAVMQQFQTMFIPATLFYAVHGGLGDIQGAAEHGDPQLPKGSAPYLEEALAKHHFPMSPPPGSDPPEIVFSLCGNVLRSSKQGERIRDSLFAKARLVV